MPGRLRRRFCRLVWDLPQPFIHKTFDLYLQHLFALVAITRKINVLCARFRYWLSLASLRMKVWLVRLGMADCKFPPIYRRWGFVWQGPGVLSEVLRGDLSSVSMEQATVLLWVWHSCGCNLTHEITLKHYTVYSLMYSHVGYTWPAWERSDFDIESSFASSYHSTGCGNIGHLDWRGFHNM